MVKLLIFLHGSLFFIRAYGIFISQFLQMAIYRERADVEIPDPISMAGWKEVAIEESYQPLINLDGLDPRIQIDPQYYRAGIPNALYSMYLRQEAAEKLIEAASLLPEGHKLVVFDSFWPLEVQENLFNTFKTQLREQYPEKSEEELVGLTQTYVSLPSKDPMKPSPHATGGAVDLSVVGPSGLPLDMGTDFDSFEITAQTAYFKKDPKTENIHQNRRLLYMVMTQAGFTNYPEEWWHYDFGNQFWGKITGEKAKYGLADIEELNGRVLGPLTGNMDSVYYRLRADGPIDRSVRFGLAGSKGYLIAALEDLSNLQNPYFGVKQQLAGIIARKHNVHRFAL